jgi:TatD DNase family protein
VTDDVTDLTDAIDAETEGRPGEEAPLGAIDTHCHLFLIDQPTGDVVAAAREAGVDRLVCVGIDTESSRLAVELAESFRGVFATAGVHPHTASEFDRAAGSLIEELLADPMVVGVGETGLDAFRRLSPMEDQERAFRTHIALSREYDKPLVVHVRDAWEEAMRILHDEGAERVVLHCFTGDAATAAEAQERGYVVSFSGNVTYPKSEDLRATVATVASGRFVVETDSPFLTPQPRRGRDNTPANVIDTLRLIAEVRGEPLDDVIEATTRAALAAFPLVR